MLASLRILLVCALLAGASPIRAQVPATSAGSVAFCLYELPADDGGRRRWVNLGIVQFVETSPSEVIIHFGGGHFGAGHEVRIVVANAADGLALLDRMRRTAASCR